MIEIVKKSLLAGEKFMPGMHFREPGFTIVVEDHLQKNKERIEKFRETGIHDTFIKGN